MVTQDKQVDIKSTGSKINIMEVLTKIRNKGTAT